MKNKKYVKINLRYNFLKVAFCSISISIHNHKMNLQLCILTACNIFICLCKHILEGLGKYKLFLLGALKLCPPTGKRNEV